MLGDNAMSNMAMAHSAFTVVFRNLFKVQQGLPEASPLHDLITK